MVTAYGRHQPVGGAAVVPSELIRSTRRPCREFEAKA